MVEIEVEVVELVVIEVDVDTVVVDEVEIVVVVDTVVVEDELVEVLVVELDVDVLVEIVVVDEVEVEVEVELEVEIVVLDEVVVVKPVTSYSTKNSRLLKIAGLPVLLIKTAKTSFCFINWLGMVAGVVGMTTAPGVSLTVLPVSAKMSYGLLADMAALVVVTGMALSAKLVVRL